MSLVETSRQRDPRPSFEAFWRRARQVRVHYPRVARHKKQQRYGKVLSLN